MLVTVKLIHSSQFFIGDQYTSPLLFGLNFSYLRTFAKGFSCNVSTNSSKPFLIRISQVMVYTLFLSLYFNSPNTILIVLQNHLPKNYPSDQRRSLKYKFHADKALPAFFHILFWKA